MKRRFQPKKSYGESKIARCPFCGKIATAMTEEGLNVCPVHKASKMESIKCVCGSWLEQKAGKYGPYFHCINCGNINFQKAMEMKSMMKSSEHKKTSSSQYDPEINTYKKKRVIEITTDDIEYFS